MPDSNHSPDIALAIDVGGTKAAFTIIDADGHQLTPIEKHLVPFDAQHIADPERLLAIIAPYVEQARQMPGTLRGIGLSMCGNIDMATGMAVLVPNLHWRYLPFGDMARAAFGLPVMAATDVRMAALAEVQWGAAKGVRNFAWATVGTGYGGYLYLDGKLFDGTHGFAGNFGHTTLDEVHGAPCGCGRTGCFETYVAGPGIARASQHAADSWDSPFLAAIARERPITSHDVFAAEAVRDPAAQAIIDNVIRLIAINLGSVVNILDLDMIVMGGGVVNACPDFVQRVSQRIRQHLMTEEAIRDLQVVKESFENSALVGAAADVFLRQAVLSP